MVKRFSNLNMNSSTRFSIIVILGMMLGVLTFSVFASAIDPNIKIGPNTEGNINWAKMVMELLGGLALFLYGMEGMATALRAVAGERMKVILAKLTNNRFMGATTGAFVTAIIQSSSVTTVLVISFISAGLMSLSQSVPIILGAHVGTTITAQIVAFKVTKAALAMIAIGFGAQFFSKNQKVVHYGEMLMGLGLIFFGMAVMSEATHPLRSYKPFLDLMISMENPMIGILVAAAFTGLIQSSSATTSIVVVLASQGFITLHAGIALAFGANIGTCVTALLASIGKPREAIRSAIVHITSNILGVVIWYGFVSELAELATWISPSYPELSGIERLSAEAPRQIANANTLFQLFNSVFFVIFFVPLFVRIAEFLVPDKELEEGYIIRPKYLDDDLLQTPSLALDRARLEIGHMGDRVKDMLAQSMPTVLTGDKEALNEVAIIDDEVDILHGKIVTYLANISTQSLTADQTQEFVTLMGAVNDLESIGDIVETNLIELGNKRLSAGITISEQTQKVIENLHETVARTVDAALRALIDNDQRAAREVISAKSKINALTDEAAMHEINRLVAKEPNRLPAYVIEMDAIGKLKRIYYFAKKIAKSVVPVELAGKSG